MAAEKPRPEKVAVVDEVRAHLTSASAALVTEYRGLKVKDLAHLRGSVREAGGEYRIYKNTLVRLAISELDLGAFGDMLTGPTAIAFVDGDAVLVAKALRDFAKTNPNLVIKGGVLGKAVLDAAHANALADVAPRSVLLAQFAGALAAPMRQMAGLLAAIPRNFAYGLKALIDQRGGAPEEAEVPAVEADIPAPAAEAEAPVEADAPPADAEAEAPVEADAPPADAEAEAAVTEAAVADAPAETPDETLADAGSSTDTENSDNENKE